jgi:hypothetical protein
MFTSVVNPKTVKEEGFFGFFTQVDPQEPNLALVFFLAIGSFE